jgi:hypothetical protein
MTEPKLTCEEIAAVKNCRSGLEQVNLLMHLRGLPYADAAKLRETWVQGAPDTHAILPPGPQCRPLAGFDLTARYLRG